MIAEQLQCSRDKQLYRTGVFLCSETMVVPLLDKPIQVFINHMQIHCVQHPQVSHWLDSAALYPPESRGIHGIC